MTMTSILAAVDRFPQDEAVLARALELARRHGAAVTIVHVVDLPEDMSLAPGKDGLQDQAASAARDRIEDALARHGADAVEITIRIEQGSSALRLIELCDELTPDLVVMRAHQRIGISEAILGSTTDRVIAAGQQPVLVVKRPARAPYGNVLVTTDGKDDAEGSLRFVANLLPDAALHLVQVVQVVPQLKEAMLRSGTDQSGIRAHRDALVAIARTRLNEVASMTTSDVRTHVLRGDPAASLARASRVAKVDLIAAGPGRGNLIRRAFLGSVTRRLLRDAECDVLICRPE